MEKQLQDPLIEQGKKKQLKGFLIATFALVSVIAAVALVLIFRNSSVKNQSSDDSKSSTIASETFNPQNTLNKLENLRDKFSFPAYDYKKSEYTPNVPDYTIGLGEIKNLGNFEKKSENSPNLNVIKFSDSQKQALEKNNFFVAVNEDKFFDDDPAANTARVDDWVDLYGRMGGFGAPEYRVPENSVFVSSDFLLHMYHKLLDKEFEYVEQKEFYARLRKISNSMLNGAIEGYNSSDLSSKKESYQRLISYFAVPDAILNASYPYLKNEEIVDDKSDSKEAVLANLEKIKNKIPTQSFELAKQELNLVMDAQQVTPSPLFEKYQNDLGLFFNEDYTQYGPRSHYGKNPVLRSYFRSMMWYGRQNFLVKSPELTRDAMNISLLMKKSNLMSDWDDIYVPTSFFVGESDDLGLYDYQKILTDNADVPAGDQLVAKLQSDVAQLKNPQIMSSSVAGDDVVSSSKEELQNKTKGFHFMGQRFTPDAFVFSSLTQGDEKADPKTGEKLPSMATALMIMSALGNETADQNLNDWIVSNAPNSKNVIKDRMDSLKKYFGSLDQNWWSQNIYWGWMYTLNSLSLEKNDKNGYPNFVKNEDWANKNLQSALGSWTELKHDTLLYAKQSYAEMGGGGPEGKIPPVPKGYVEPNIEFFDRLIPLAKMTKEGLMQRNLLDQEFQGRNEKLLDSLEFFRKIAIAEVNNEKISDGDFERLRMESGRLSSVVAPLPSEQGTEDLARAALIADVHTDAVKNKILYEANGIPNYIYVAVKDGNGTRLTKGLTYSYHEFTNPLEKRLTDTDWKNWVYAEDTSNVPEMAAWNKALIK
jgi:hypothetical protein